MFGVIVGLSQTELVSPDASPTTNQSTTPESFDGYLRDARNQREQDATHTSAAAVPIGPHADDSVDEPPTAEVVSPPLEAEGEAGVSDATPQVGTPGTRQVVPGLDTKSLGPSQESIQQVAKKTPREDSKRPRVKTPDEMPGGEPAMPMMGLASKASRVKDSERPVAQREHGEGDAGDRPSRDGAARKRGRPADQAAANPTTQGKSEPMRPEQRTGTTDHITDASVKREDRASFAGKRGDVTKAGQRTTDPPASVRETIPPRLRGRVSETGQPAVNQPEEKRQAEVASAPSADTTRRSPRGSGKKAVSADPAENKVEEAAKRGHIASKATLPTQDNLPAPAAKPAEPTSDVQPRSADATALSPTHDTAEGAPNIVRPSNDTSPLPTTRTDPGPSNQPTAASSQADRVKFVQRVARAFQTMGDRNGSVRLRLSPPELGSLRMEIAVRNGLMSARVEAETTTARNLLLDNLPALRERLAQQDIKVDQFNVELTDRSAGGLSEQAAGHAGHHRGNGGNSDGRPSSTHQASEVQPSASPVTLGQAGEGARLNIVI